MANVDKQHYALQTIFSFFLGLMVLAFIGIGVNTFYQSPEQQRQAESDSISRQIESLNVKSNGRSLDATQQAQMDRLTAQQTNLQQQISSAMQGWARNTSIILIAFATLVMGISLIRAEQLRVLSNGLLLGGLFTMLYGTGWVIFSGSSTVRFFVISFALVVAIGLGYLKFVRERAEQPVAHAEATGATASVDASGVAELEARVAALEDRAAAAAAALGGGAGQE